MTKSMKQLLAVVEAKAKLHEDLKDMYKRDSKDVEYKAYSNSWIALLSVIEIIKDKKFLKEIAQTLDVDLSTIQ